MIQWHLDLHFRTFDGGFRLDVDADGAGPIMGIFGPSGSGKSTLIEALLGWTPTGVASGTVTCAGEPRTAPTPLARRGLAWSPQDAPLVWTQCVTNNARLGDPDASDDRLAAVLTAMELSEPHRRAGDLSGGERQRVSLARAILGGDRLRRQGIATPLLLLDEPLSAVDHQRRGRLLRWLKRDLEDAKAAAILVSHSWSEVESFCDHALILSGGRVVRSGPPAQLSATANDV